MLITHLSNKDFCNSGSIEKARPLCFHKERGIIHNNYIVLIAKNLYRQNLSQNLKEGVGNGK